MPPARFLAGISSWELTELMVNDRLADEDRKEAEQRAELAARAQQGMAAMKAPRRGR